MALSQTKKPPAEVSEVNFRELQPAPQQAVDPKKSLDLDFILDIPLTLNVELGRNRMLISDLLQLGQGSVIELAKLAGEPMDVYVNQRLIARGEVVVVNEKFGIRLTDSVSPVDGSTIFAERDVDFSFFSALLRKCSLPWRWFWAS
jgi:flagellar motor switch protein FliN/FliY